MCVVYHGGSQDERVNEQKPSSTSVNDMENSHGNIVVNGATLCGEMFICICDKGVMMKRKGRLPSGDQRKLIKFNGMSTFTNSNVCLSNLTEIKTQKWSAANTRRERWFVNTEC